MTATPPSLRRLINVLDALVDERVGIIERVREVRRQAGAPDFFHFAAATCNTGAFSREQNFRFNGGASRDRDLAMAKAIGEAIERYCGAVFDSEELPLCPSASAPFPCVPPQEFALYSREQYERPGFLFVPFDEQTPVRWIQALDPRTGAACSVPAAMVYVPYTYYLGSGDSPIAQPISTGLACHCSLAEAAVTAACEVVERDALMITWQARLAMPQLRIETLSDANYDLVERFERTGAVVTLLNITMDASVPTILAVLRQEVPEAVPFAMAAVAHPDPEQAVCKSLEELEHTRHYSQILKDRCPRLVPDPNHDNIIDQDSHLNFWCDHAHAPLADFLFGSDERVEFDEVESLATGDPRRDLKILCERVRSIGHRVLLVDVTTQDVRDLGLAVVRAIIPGFHPLCMGFHTRALGGSRLWEVPQRLGHRGITRESGDNPIPHPYP